MKLIQVGDIGVNLDLVTEYDLDFLRAGTTDSGVLLYFAARDEAGQASRVFFDEDAEALRIYLRGLAMHLPVQAPDPQPQP